MYGDGFYGMGHGFGGIFMILFWVVIIYLIVRGTSHWTQKGSEQNSRKSAEDILKERYAKGDISKEEFEQMKQDLRF
ncbi:SHOCT domain-containing protein [Malonomonas rubra]|uniref:SHOCT domain-containing protein n=1 Tax=Malonomonas rubra TaxID=57040 RepID=UPI0034E96521